MTFMATSAFSYYLLIKNLNTTLNSFRNTRNSSENEREKPHKSGWSVVVLEPKS